MLAAGVILLAGCETMDAPVVQAGPPPVAESASAVENLLPWDSNRPGVRKLPSGVEIVVVRQGGPPLGNLTGDTEIAFSMTAWASKAGGGAPFTLALETWKRQTMDYQIGEFVPGLQEAVKGMGRGERIAVFIPSRLAYGPRGQNAGPDGNGQAAIPPNADLVFDFELIDAK